MNEDQNQNEVQNQNGYEYKEEMNYDPSENHADPSESYADPSEERNEPSVGQDNDAGQPEPSGYIEDDETEGLNFNLSALLIGLGMVFVLFYDSSIFSGNWSFLLCLFAAVIIHEMGHVIFGRMFGCEIKEMQVFFMPFVSYKPRQTDGGSPWRNVRWSLGSLPLGGLTVFRSRAMEDDDTDEEQAALYADAPADSPYIDDKAAWQRLLISAAGVLFNLATFAILYLVLPHMSIDAYLSWWPLLSLSLIMALLNILPIYPLDGGAVLFALYEIISGRKPSPGFTRICGWTGFVIIILLFWVFPEWISGLISPILDSLFYPEVPHGEGCF